MPDNGGGVRSRSLVFPILLVAIGSIFLYRTLHPGFEPWPVLWHYWPLILILVGLGKMWDASQGAREAGRSGVYIGSTVGILAAVVIIVLLLWHGNAFSNREGRYGRHLDHVSETRELQGATSLNAEVAIGAGELNIDGGTSLAFDSDFTFSPAWSQPKVDYNVSSGIGDLNISQDNHGPTLGSDDNTWRLHLNKSVPVSLQVKMGAGQGNLKFRELNLKDLRVEMGAGQVNIDLTGEERKSDVNVEMHGGVGQAVIRLPKSIGVSVDAKGGIGAVTTHGLKNVGGSYVNEAYGKSPRTIHIQATGGIGNIDLSVEP
jgi:hypothetical protein